MNFANLIPISKLVIKNNRHETNLGNFNLWVIRWGYHYTFPLSFFYPSNQTKQRKVLFSGQFPWGGFLNSLFGYWMVFFRVCFRSLWFTTEHVPLLKVHKLTGLEGPWFQSKTFGPVFIAQPRSCHLWEVPCVRIRF